MYTIRLARASDAAQIAAIYAPIVEQTTISFEERAPTADEIRERMLASADRMPWFVADDAGDVLGYVYASEHRSRAAYRWSVDVTAYVGEGARRSGLGRALYGELFQTLTLQGYHNAFAGITLPNEASIGLHRAMGFEPVGVYRNAGYKLGRWCDVSRWQRELKPPEPAPSEPRTVSDVF